MVQEKITLSVGRAIRRSRRGHSTLRIADQSECSPADAFPCYDRPARLNLDVGNVAESYFAPA